MLGLVNRATIMKWMLEEVRDKGEKHLCFKAVQKLPELFCRSNSANSMIWLKIRVRIICASKLCKGSLSSFTDLIVRIA